MELQTQQRYLLKSQKLEKSILFRASGEEYLRRRVGELLDISLTHLTLVRSGPNRIQVFIKGKETGEVVIL